LAPAELKGTIKKNMQNGNKIAGAAVAGENQRMCAKWAGRIEVAGGLRVTKSALARV